MRPLRFQLDWKPNAQFAGVLVAHHLGWYREAGIDLTISPWEVNSDAIAALASEEAVVASTEDNLLIRARADGQPVKAIGAMLQHSGIGWMSLSDSGIERPGDLAGRTVGVHGDGELALDVVLAGAGLSPSDISRIEIGYDYGELLERGVCDAAQCFVMVEPAELATRGITTTSLVAYEHGYPSYAQVMVAPDRLVEDQPDMLAALLSVTFDGWRRALAEPDEAAAVIVGHFLPEGSFEVEMGIIEAMTPFVVGEVGRARLGWMEATRWDQTIDLLYGHRLVAQRVATAEIMTNQLMESVYG